MDFKWAYAAVLVLTVWGGLLLFGIHIPYLIDPTLGNAIVLLFLALMVLVIAMAIRRNAAHAEKR